MNRGENGEGLEIELRKWQFQSQFISNIQFYYTFRVRIMNLFKSKQNNELYESKRLKNILPQFQILISTFCFS